LQSGYPVSGLKFELRTYRKRRRSANNWTETLVVTFTGVVCQCQSVRKYNMCVLVGTRRGSLNLNFQYLMRLQSWGAETVSDIQNYRRI
jgi:hypothetical protein